MDIEDGIEELQSCRLWTILVCNVKKDWNQRIRKVWLRTLLLSLILHLALCVAGEISWMVIFEPSLASELKNILIPSSFDSQSTSNALASTFSTHISRILYKFKIELCVYLLLVFIMTLFANTLKKRVDICGRIFTQVILDLSKLNLEALGFLAEPTCITDVEDIFLRLLNPMRRSQANIISPEILQSGASSIINWKPLYNPLFCAFFHCPLIAFVCFLKFSMVPLLASALGLGDESSMDYSFPPATFIFSLIFGLIYLLALLCVAVLWSIYAYHRLPTAEDMWSSFVMDVDLFVSQV
ncbi:hypothetical protein J3R30DRAFT_1324015 [Lentinula aciculospora]|uniref:Uncharacterized protein n=1 Tax=Lentinula aciculospora TaxID=153920 RepID=A0A9W9AL54_9AGAR|nr:hypothetical protein J3R30DRAFT_1324015 [Lentinula aciculospora]